MQRFFIFLAIFFSVPLVHGQPANGTRSIEVTVRSLDGNMPVEGVSLVTEKAIFSTDSHGKVRLTDVKTGEYIRVHHIGYHAQRIPVDTLLHNPVIQLKTHETVLDDVVVSTGYYSLPKERSTGSFTLVDRSVLDKSVSYDVLSKLEGVTSSLHFDRRFDRTEWTSGEPEIRVRGLSTINSETKPLIILDNFPYEGDLDLINPEDIESISIAKDAAAASIWGARASNGVIVINTKKGRYNNRPRITLSSGLVIGEKPNLHYDPNFLNSDATILAERIFFENGNYVEADNTPLSPVVEMLILERDGKLTENELETALEGLADLDVRDEALRYMYRNSNSVQHSLGIDGGGETFNYYISLGYDKNLQSIAGNKNDRLTLNSNNTVKLSKHIELKTHVSLSQQSTVNNGLGLYTSNAAGRSSYYPYARLKDGDDNLPVLGEYRSTYVENAENEGLLDWQLRPLDEVYLNDDQSRRRQLNLSSTLTVQLASGLDVDAYYNYQVTGSKTELLHDQDSYYVRNLVNKYTQGDGTLIFPLGQVFFSESNESKQHLGRIQFNYNKTFNRNQRLNVLAGAEVRQVKYISGPRQQLLGYDDESLAFNNALDYSTRYPTRPRGTLVALPPPPNDMSDLVDRFVSYYANAAYDFDRRYVLNGSIRWDASNLFGVNINQKGVPLWSLGLGWHLMNESFYPSGGLLPKLSVRATHGVNGNINNSVSAFPAIRYIYNSSLQIQTANLVSPGNSNLRWEKTRITNLGLDFGFKEDRVFGSFDYYWKQNRDLLGEDQLNPTGGISTLGGANIVYLVNYADMVTKGFDLDITSNNLVGEIRWNSNLILSRSTNEITRYHGKDNISIYPYFQNRIAPPHEGESRDVLYGFPWYGLGGENGYQNIQLEGELSQDYSKYITTVKQEDLIKKGTGVPLLTGSLRNSFFYNNIDLSFNILWKSGYYFRRNSIFYQSFFSSLLGHRDFTNRWIEPGDELRTMVPAIPDSPSSTQDNVYRYSEALIEKGDHIRLHDVHLGYKFRQLYLQVYGRNLGIIWRANRNNLDPDYPIARYPAIRTIGIKVKATF